MKKWLVKLFYNLGWHGLARRISVSLYYACVGERLAQQCREATEAFAAFVNAVGEALPKKEEINNERSENLH